MKPTGRSDARSFSLAGRVALVTACSKGIGKACALALARAGADVVLGLREKAAGRALAERIAGMGRQALCVQMDVSNMGEIASGVRAGLDRFERIDILVNNAGIGESNPAERAIRMALEMRDRVGALSVKWRKRGYDLEFGVGIAQGYATIGAIGFEGRADYGAIGTVTNLASRLCGEAKPGQILVSQRLLGAVEDLMEVEPVGELQLKGFLKPVPAFNVVHLKS